MSVRSIVITVLGIACGLFAALGVYQMASRPPAEPVKEVVEIPMTKIVVAYSEVERGKVVTKDSLDLKDWPADYVPEGALRNVDTAAGRIAISTLFPGEPIMDAKLVPTGAYLGAGNLIPAGMRAYSIVCSNAASSVAGLILPGDKVDVILTIQSNMQNDPSGGGTSTTLLQNVEILAIDRNLDAQESQDSTSNLTSVTLLVTQRQAAFLGLGQKVGVMTMALRNPEDDDNAETAPVTLAELRLHEEFSKPTSDETTATEPPPVVEPAPAPAIAEVAVPPAPTKPRNTSIQTLRGSQRGVVSVQLPRHRE